MATVELKNVILHYTVSPFTPVYARVRSYVDGVAFKEDTVEVSADALVARGGEQWTEKDLAAELGDHVWAIDALDTLRADAAYTEDVEKYEAKKAGVEQAAVKG